MRYETQLSDLTNIERKRGPHRLIPPLTRRRDRTFRLRTEGHEWMSWSDATERNEDDHSMVQQEHVDTLRNGVEAWNTWRAEQVSIAPDLSGADLSETHLRDIHLAGANLKGTNLAGAWLERANLLAANLEEANLEGVHLENANLSEARLDRANLLVANLAWTNLERGDPGASEPRRGEADGSQTRRGRSHRG